MPTTFLSHTTDLVRTPNWATDAATLIQWTRLNRLYIYHFSRDHSPSPSDPLKASTRVLVLHLLTTQTRACSASSGVSSITSLYAESMCLFMFYPDVEQRCGALKGRHLLISTASQSAWCSAISRLCYILLRHIYNTPWHICTQLERSTLRPMHCVNSPNLR